MKKFLKILSSIIGIVVVLLAILLIFLTVTDYNPDKKVEIPINNNAKTQMNSKNEVSIITWNIGYAGLGQKEDFFFDGGSKSKPSSKEVVNGYLDGIISSLNNYKADFFMFQEVDVDSSRSYNIDELAKISQNYSDYSYSFACNYNIKYIPVPLPPTGKVKAGQVTLSKYGVKEATRYAFPGNYSWPKKTVMLDRCFSVTRVPIEDKEGDLLIINAHFSAYDDGSLREQQLQCVKKYVLEEYNKGNYVVLGGDWNQTFDTIDADKFPLYKNGSFYTPYSISSDWLEKGWNWGINDNVPTYRLLNAPYEEGKTQIGVIDGFLVSPNISIIKAEVIDFKFVNSDHNPVFMKFNLK